MASSQKFTWPAPLPSRLDVFANRASPIEGIEIHCLAEVVFIRGNPERIIAAGYADATWFGGRRGADGRWLSLRFFLLNGRKVETRINPDRTDCEVAIWLRRPAVSLISQDARFMEAMERVLGDDPCIDWHPLPKKRAKLIKYAEGVDKLAARARR